MKLLSTDPIVSNIDGELDEDFKSLTLSAGGTELILIVADRIGETNTFLIFLSFNKKSRICGNPIK